MIKSLYTRVVLIFLVSVIGGTVFSFFMATWIFKDQLNENLQIPLLAFGRDIVRIYDTLPPEEAEAYISGMHQLNTYHVRIYDEEGQFRSYGSVAGYEETPVTPEQVDQVFNGEIIHFNTGWVSTTLVGFSFATDTGAKAMFIEPVGPPSTPFIILWLFNFVLFSLAAGSLFILIAAMFLVKPIKKLTKATRHVAGGNFNVKLNIRQKGELGELANSFEEMIHDLQQLEYMRRDFVSNVSHEIQSPLTSISGFALALKQENIADGDRNRYLDIIIAEAKRMSTMSDSLLKLSMLESESRKLKMVTFSLDEQIRRVIVALQPQWAARNITFDLDLANFRLTGDFDLLNQAWSNIIGNSIKFSPDGGVIEVKIMEEQRNVIVSVADRGIGISSEDQKRMFERFFKADRSHSRKYAGSGMGLAIVKQIVSLHDGDIRAESELGQGTTVIVSLPASLPVSSSTEPV